MKRILFISHSAGGAGAERSLLEIIKTIDKNKFKVIVLYPLFGGNYFKDEVSKIENIKTFSLNYKQIPHHNISFIRLAANIVSQIFNTIKILILIKRYNVDVVVSNTSTVVIGALSARAARVNHVWSLREQTPAYVFFPFITSKRFQRFISNNSQLIIFNSKWLMDSYEHSNKTNAHVVINVFSDFLPNTSRRLAFAPDSVITLGVVGTIAEHKNQMLCVQVAQLLRQMSFNIRLLVTGKVSDVKYRDSIQAEINKSNLGSEVQISDFVSDISEIYRKIDILLVPSKVESFGRVVVEGLHSGCIVIASAVGGIPEIITHRVNGMLVDNICSDGFASAIIELLRNKSLRDALIANGRRSVNEYFIDTSVRQFEQLILKIGN